VTVSAGLYRLGRIRFDDLQWQHGYRKWRAYGQSKLANLLFTFELQRRAEAAGAALTSLACHPGYAATNLQAAGPKMQGSALRESLMGLANRLVPPGQALAVASDLARRLSQNAPLALAATKRVIVESADWPADEGFARQNEITAPVFGSADAIEGAAAFAEKRPPVWRGR